MFHNYESNDGPGSGICEDRGVADPKTAMFSVCLKTKWLPAGNLQGEARRL